MFKDTGKRLFLLGTAIFLLGGCAPRETPQSVQESKNARLQYEERHVRGTLCEGVTVDADLPDTSRITEYDVILARMTEPKERDIQSVKEYLFRKDAPEKIVEKRTVDGDMLHYYVPVDGTEEERRMVVYLTPGERGLSFSDTQACPWPAIYYDYTIRPGETKNLTDEMDLLAHSGKEDLPFMKRSEAVDTAKKYLKEWGFDTVGEPLVFSVQGSDLHQLLEYWNEIDFYDTPIAGTPKEKLDCYYMVFDTGYHQIPYTYFEQAIGGVYSLGQHLFVRFTDQGIVWLSSCAAQYEVEKVLEEHEKCISIEQAFAAVKEYYENMVAVSDLEIEKIYFQYVPSDVDRKTETYTFRPTWIFQTAGEIQGEKLYLERVSVDGITGEVG